MYIYIYIYIIADISMCDDPCQEAMRLKGPCGASSISLDAFFRATTILNPKTTICVNKSTTVQPAHT